MGIQSRNLHLDKTGAGLPLFDAAERQARQAREDETYERWKSGDIGTAINRVKRKTGDDAQEVLSAEAVHSDDREKIVILDEDVIFSDDKAHYFGGNDSITYLNEGEEEGHIGLFRIEHHEFYNIAVVEIAHRFPGHEYIHKGRKRNPSTGRYDGKEVHIPKVSSGTTVKKRYRIQYTSGKIGEGNYGVFCFGGNVKDGNQVNLNLDSIIPALRKIENLALQKIGIQ